MNLTILDFIFIVLIAFFALSALIRGFINEVFGKVSVFLAIGASVLFSPKFEVFVHQSIQNEIVSKVVSYILIFIVFFLAIKIVQSILSKIFSCSILKSLDRVMGFALGLLEGIVVVALIVMVLAKQPWFDVLEITKGSFFFDILNFSASQTALSGVVS